ncbi:MAG TPA: 6-bladed beta-propeller [Verrucomicrobiae bacterium]|nr:6-bladed beta-propeller [Verrucomicrobiae bacterium]
MNAGQVALGIRLKRAFTDFNNEKLRKILGAILLAMSLLFLYLYMSKIDVVNMGRQQLPIAGPPQLMFNIFGTESEPLRKPTAVIEMARKIYVSDTDNHRIQVFDYEGNPLQIIGKEGKGKGEFGYPYGLAADANDQLYVADIVNNNISVLSGSGEFIRYFGNGTDLKRPAGIFIDGSTVYVADIGLHKVVIFDINGQKLGEIGEAGVEPGKLRSPNAVAVAKGKVYVSDTGNDRVQIFTASGQFLGLLDGPAQPGGQSNLLAPRGVCVDERGTVFVVNNLLHTVNGYGQSDQKLFSFGSMGNAVEQFFLPIGIWVNGQGRVYITDSVNQRIDVYQN